MFATLFPILVFSSIMILLFSKQEQAEVERELRERARILALAVDQELISAMHTLQALATSEDLDSEAFADFYRLASRVMTSQSEWATIILYDLSGREIVNSVRAFGVKSPHAATELESFDRVLRTWKPVLGANFLIAPEKEPVVTVLIPVLRDGKLKYVLAAGIETIIFDNLLKQRKIPFDWVATVADQNNYIVANTRSPEFFGKPAGPLMPKATADQLEGWIKGHNEDGVYSYMAFSRAPVSEWSVALGIPASTIDVPLRRSLWTLAAVGMSFLVVGILFASIFGRRIAQSIHSLSLATKALGRGDPVVISRPSSVVAEVDALGRDLEQASALLRQHAHRRDQAEAALQRQANLLEQSHDPIFVRKFRGPIIYWNRAAEELYGYSKAEVIGRTRDQLLPTVFPDGVAEWEQTLERAGHWEGELIRTGRDGEKLVIESRQQLIHELDGDYVLETNRNITARKRSERRLAAEHAVARLLSEARTFEEISEKLLQAIGEGLEWEFGAFWIVDEKEKILRCAETWYPSSKNFPEFEATCRQMTFSPEIGLPGRVWASTKAAWVADVVNDKNFPRAPVAARENLHGAFAFPIFLSGKFFGVVEFFSHEVALPDSDLLKMAEVTGLEIGQFMERVRAEERLHKLNLELEQRVMERTAELESVNENLQLEIQERRQAEEALQREHIYLNLLRMTAVAADGCASVEGALTAAVEQICQHMDWPVGRGYILPDHSATGRATTMWRLKDPQRFVRLRSAIDATPGGPYRESLVNRVLTLRKVERISDVSQESDLLWAEEAVTAGIRAALAFPVWNGLEILGVLEFFSDGSLQTEERLSGVMAQISVQLSRIVERKDAERKLQASEERFRLAFDEGPMGVTMAGLDHSYLKVNRAFCRMLGYTEQELVGRSFLQLTHPEDVDRTERLVERVTKGEMPFYRLEMRFIGKNKEVIWTNVTGSIVRDQDHKALYGLAMIEDITEHKRMEEKLRESERLATLGAAAAMFAHEIGNPLNGISTTIQVLERQLAKKSRAQDGLGILKDLRAEVNRLGSLLQEFRFLARPQQLDLQPTDMSNLIAELLAVEAPQYAQAGIRVNVEFAPNMPPAMVDGGKVKQALLNLCSNAAEAMPQGGTLTLRGYKSDGEVCLEVADTGIGIAEGLDIFKLFTTTKPEGTGLGLAIVRQVVSAHGGWINYRSRPGEGTVFRLTLPSV